MNRSFLIAAMLAVGLDRLRRKTRPRPRSGARAGTCRYTGARPGTSAGPGSHEGRAEG